MSTASSSTDELTSSNASPPATRDPLLILRFTVAPPDQLPQWCSHPRKPPTTAPSAPRPDELRRHAERRNTANREFVRPIGRATALGIRARAPTVRSRR